MTTNNQKKSIVREALPKPNILQLSEYDITQKIMDSLTNACHRSVLFSIIKDSKDAPKIAEELNISLSAVYKTLVKLEELTLVEIDTFNFVEGKKVKLYKSRIGRAEITFDNNDATLHLYPNKNNEK
ncbi:MAG: ArsR family transcriptional regulator [Thermoproteota archaeon]|nr:ArsR family transcriptional regulator [Thermoproteota archaeon]|tara:strand:+ start:260 stop:640 length:381 start_codon:yes stop_codon:yes gene_type:complete